MVKRIALATLACAACEGFSTPPQPIVSVLRRTPAGCFALMTPDAPVDPVLGVQDLCTEGDPPTLFGGIDFVEAVIDYGPDVEFANDTHAPPPTVTFLVDGMPSDTTITLTDEQRVGARAYFLATFLTPATPSLDARLVAGVNPGFQTEVPDTFAIVSPPVSLAITDCGTSGPCVLVGAVGSAHVQVAVPGTVPQTVTLVAALNGVPLPAPSPPVITAPSGDHTEITTAIPVPAAPGGSLWVITAELGPSMSTSGAIMIGAPVIDSALSCAPTCSIAAGDPVGLAIAAPGEIRPLQALVSTTLDGVPQLVNATVDLVTMADGNAHGSLALVAPQAGTWAIDVSIAGYPAPTLVETVH